MTINTRPAKNWSAHNGGQDDPQFNSCSPNLTAIRVAAQHQWGLGMLGCYGERDVRAGTAPSAHSHGAAIDLRYAEQIGRTRFLNEVVPWLITNSAELHISAIHDYVGCRIWHAGRTGNEDDAYTGWWKPQSPSAATGMGQSWAGWVHIETTEEGWADGSPVAKRLTSFQPTTPPPVVVAPPTSPDRKEGDMLVVVGCKNDPVNPNRRWLWNGVSIRLMKSEDEFNRAKLLFQLHPTFNTLASPFWMELHEIEEFTA